MCFPTDNHRFNTFTSLICFWTERLLRARYPCVAVKFGTNAPAHNRSRCLLSGLTHRPVLYQAASGRQPPKHIHMWTSAETRCVNTRSVFKHSGNQPWRRTRRLCAPRNNVFGRSSTGTDCTFGNCFLETDFSFVTRGPRVLRHLLETLRRGAYASWPAE